MVSQEGIEKALDDIENLKKELKELQQHISGMKINSDSHSIEDIINAQFPNKHTLKTQMLTDATRAKSQIEVSSEPWVIVKEFHDKWENELEHLGADFINY
jgi:hypothetical protein